MEREQFQEQVKACLILNLNIKAFTAGDIKTNPEKLWEITSDKWILNTVSGATIELDDIDNVPLDNVFDEKSLSTFLREKNTKITCLSCI